MTEQEIKKLMRDFVVELKRGHMLRNESDAIYNDVSNKLYKYYREGERDKAIKNALDDMHGDIYINIIPLFYKNHYTIEKIAEMMDVDISTVSRNKKRICVSIYAMLEWS